MTHKESTLLTLFIFLALLTKAQQPEYTPKHFVSIDNPGEFVRLVPRKTGFVRTFLLVSSTIWDTDDRNTTFIRIGQTVLLCIEGEWINGQRQGIFTSYLIDSLDHNKRYKIGEQTYANDKLNGQWRTYTLKGILHSFQTYINDSLNGIARNFWIDGRTIIEEKEYENSRNKFILREFGPNGKKSAETTYVGNMPNGPARKYYENGILQDEVVLKNGVPNGLRKYYYPSGKLWVEQEMKNGEPWTILQIIQSQARGALQAH